eukprot:snap_masked-scaffold_21-processed-gene-2.16-mRNA-1 protein AED:0.99 eAED:1.00 QI:0/0/0/0.5/1/1/2/0/59
MFTANIGIMKNILRAMPCVSLDNVLTNFMAINSIAIGGFEFCNHYWLTGDLFPFFSRKI